MYCLKSGKVDIESKVKHLKKLSKGTKVENRCHAFCEYILSGKKYEVNEPASFESEVIDFESLIRMV